MMNLLRPQHIVFALISCVIISASGVQTSAQTAIPNGQKEGPEHASQAEAFMESLHTVPKGMNWKTVNAAVREGRVKRLRTKGEFTQGGDAAVKGTWTELGSNNQAGRVLCVDYNQELGQIYVAGAGGTIWTGTSEGTDYENLNEFQRISYPRLLKHVEMPDRSSRLIAVSNEPRAFTLDEGNTLWDEAGGFEENQRWGGINKAVWCERQGRLEILTVGNEWDYGEGWRGMSVIYRSIDSGKTFQRLQWFTGARTLWTDNQDNVLLLHGDTLSAVEPDGSLSQIALVPQFNRGGNSAIIAGVSIDNLVLSSTQSGVTNFHHSSDGGKTWTATGTLPIGPFDRNSFAQAVDNTKAWLFGGVDTWRSTDFGATWEQASFWGQYYGNPAARLHADIPAIISLNTFEGPITFVCTDGGLFRSSDGLYNVRNISLEGLNVSQYYGSYTGRDNVDVVHAGSQDQGYQRSRSRNGDQPRDFDQLISGDYARLSSGDGGASIFCVYPGFTMFWPNAESGGRQYSREFDHRRHLWLPPLAVNPNKPREALVGGGRIDDVGTRLYIYRMNGNIMELDSVDFDFGEGADNVNICAVAVAETDPLRQYVVTTNGFVWSSSDEGITWEKNPRPEGLDGHYFGGNALAIDPNNSRRVFIGGSGYGQDAVWISEDAGKTFSALKGLPQLLVFGLSVSADGNLIAAATDAGAYIYNISAGSWTDVTEQGGPDQTYWHVEWVPPLQRFRFSTYGRGLWDFVPDEVTSVEELGEFDYSIALRGVLTPTGGAVQFVGDSAPRGELTVSWFDVTGRRLHREYLSSIDRSQILRPSNVPPGSMVVIQDSQGRTGATVIP